MLLFVTSENVCVGNSPSQNSGEQLVCGEDIQESMQLVCGEDIQESS